VSPFSLGTHKLPDTIFGFAAFGALTASGSTERSRGLAYLATALLVVAMAILIGVFLAD
jgi:hypothetical protein